MEEHERKPGGDPSKPADAVVQPSDSPNLPLLFIAGTDAVDGVEDNFATIRGQIDAHRNLHVPVLRLENRE